MQDDYHSRFAGYANLIGNTDLEKLQRCGITVVGLGGVGSWVAESLARCGCGSMTLIDYDHITLGNTNRQLHSLDGVYGRSKVSVMSERLRLINPSITVFEVDDFLTPDNIDRILDPRSALIDACDMIPSKISMAQWAISRKVPFVMCGSAGGKTDPTKLRITHIGSAIHDVLLQKTRRMLNKLDFKCDNLAVITSTEPKRTPTHRSISGPGISCTGQGSCVTVTATMGLLASHAMIEQLIK